MRPSPPGPLLPAGVQGLERWPPARRAPRPPAASCGARGRRSRFMNAPVSRIAHGTNDVTGPGGQGSRGIGSLTQSRVLAYSAIRAVLNKNPIPFSSRSG
ncbi:MAG: hypothetical protein DME26_02720 [Verrucomicrobia bacterium]|nr:MAG: hypothetical protein DME26_02720 [Verrucomicrobiota bacterium]